MDLMITGRRGSYDGPRTQAKPPQSSDPAGLKRKPIRVILLALPSSSPINVFGPAEVFEVVNADLSELLNDVRIISLEPRGIAPKTYEQFVDEFELPELVPNADTILFAGGHSGPMAFPEHRMKELVEWARLHCAAARRVAGVGSGSLLLAEAGLLRQKQATTHWTYLEHMATRYPEVQVLSDRIYVKDGFCYTAAGGTSAIDLALALVEEDLGTNAAAEAAKHLLLFLRRSSTQPQLSTTLLAQKSSVGSIGNLLVWMADNLDKDLSVYSFARRMAMSPRNFARYPSINFGLILAGSCLLIKEGAANVLLEAGDFLFLSRPSDYSLASDVNVSPLKAEPALAAATSDCLVVGDGQHCSVRIMPGYFLLNPDNPDLLTDLLLPVVHVATSDADASQFRLLLQLVSEEASQQLPGRTLVLSRFLDILLMRVLRCLISSLNMT